MRLLYFSREQLTADDVSARPLGASVAPLALGYVDRSTHIHNVENPRRGNYVLVTPENSDAPGATGAASTQQEAHWSTEVASKMGILSVAAGSSRRTDPA